MEKGEAEENMCNNIFFNRRWPSLIPNKNQYNQMLVNKIMCVCFSAY